MKAHLLFRNQDFDWKWALEAAAERGATRNGFRFSRNPSFNPLQGLPWNWEELTADLSLTTLFDAMAREDHCVFEVCRKVVLASVAGDLDTILYRQDILRDCLKEPDVVRELYAVAVEAIEKQRGRFFGSLLSSYPDSILRDAIERMTVFIQSLRELRRIAESHAPRFQSEGWIAFFAMLMCDLGDEYFAAVQEHLDVLKFRNGELLTAQLGRANKGGNYVLHRVPHRRWRFLTWWKDLFGEKEPVFRFELHPRDEPGAKALATLRNRAVSLAAAALAESADHVRDFFGMLKTELAFYIGCVNLHERLTEKEEPLCMPVPSPPSEPRLACSGLYDVGLALTVDRRVVGNDTNADGKELVVITGPNTGGKSTFLRSVGLAQLMMQGGMFVPAASFCGSVCDGIFTHYKREEDAGMQRGKFDEELSRMSEIVDHVAPRSMILFNESFAATNEREGSEIARQIISALVGKGVRALCVTHMYELARGFFEANQGNMLFLRAERDADGVRTFKLPEGEPLPTSFGEDLYNRVFAAETDGTEVDETKTRARA
jgi:MutS domain V